jgi:hypothetical protein
MRAARRRALEGGLNGCRGLFYDPNLSLTFQPLPKRQLFVFAWMPGMPPSLKRRGGFLNFINRRRDFPNKKHGNSKTMFFGLEKTEASADSKAHLPRQARSVVF